jgi:hypothetical protein
MSQDIQKFLDNCKTIQRIVDVTIEDVLPRVSYLNDFRYK